MSKAGLVMIDMKAIILGSLLLTATVDTCSATLFSHIWPRSKPSTISTVARSRPANHQDSGYSASGRLYFPTQSHPRGATPSPARAKSAHRRNH
jgi:hypothetical protein